MEVDAQHQMAEELHSLGLITKNEYETDSMDNPACKKFFMHGLATTGLGVHDAVPSSPQAGVDRDVNLASYS